MGNHWVLPQYSVPHYYIFNYVTNFVYNLFR